MTEEMKQAPLPEEVEKAFKCFSHTDYDAMMWFKKNTDALKRRKSAPTSPHKLRRLRG